MFVDHAEHLRLAATIAGLEIPDVVMPDARGFTVGQLPLHYLDWGTAGRVPILFLHGGCVTAHTWDLPCLALRTDYHCFALDQRGHGDSGWPADRDYRWEAYIGDIAAWADHLQLDRFVLVGHSMGALNALGFALDHADRLLALVAVDVGLALPERPGAARIRDFVNLPPELESVDDFVSRAVAFNPLRHPALLRRSLLHNLRRLPDGSWTWKYDRALLGAPFQRLRASFTSLQRRIADITCPLLVVRGAMSDVITTDDAAALAHAVPNGRVVEVDGAGHTVHGDNTLGFLAALRGFLADLGPTPSGAAARPVRT